MSITHWEHLDELTQTGSQGTAWGLRGGPSVCALMGEPWEIPRPHLTWRSGAVHTLEYCTGYLFYRCGTTEKNQEFYFRKTHSQTWQQSYQRSQRTFLWGIRNRFSQEAQRKGRALALVHLKCRRPLAGSQFRSSP